jgi:hypothetical protein
VPFTKDAGTCYISVQKAALTGKLEGKGFCHVSHLNFFDPAAYVLGPHDVDVKAQAARLISGGIDCLHVCLVKGSKVAKPKDAGVLCLESNRCKRCGLEFAMSLC